MALGNIYLDENAGRLCEAYWRWLFLSQSWRDAEALSKALRRPPADVDTPAAAQFIERVAALAAQTGAIDDAEAEMDAHLFELYALTPEERFLVEKDRARRGGP